MERSILWWLEVAGFGLAAAMGCRVIVKPPIRRELRARPLIGSGLIAAVVVVAAAILWAAGRVDFLRHLLFAGVGLVSLFAWWRARPEYGRRRGLPPGSLGLAASLDAVDDHDFYLHAAARWGSIFKTSQIHQPVVCIVDSGLGQDLIERRRDVLVQVEWPYNRLFPGGYFEFMNGDLHARYRAIFAPALGPEVVADSRAAIVAGVRRQLEAMARAPNPGDLDPEPFLYPTAFQALVRVVLGISADDPRMPALLKLVTELNRPYELFLPTPARMETAYRETAALVERLTRAAVIAGPVPAGARSVLSQIIAADPNQAANPTTIGNLIMMVKDGSTIVRGQLRWVIKAIADDPQWANHLAELARTGANGAQVDAMATSLVHETLRVFGTQYVYRRVVRDLEVGSHRLPKGWLVRICYDAAHANPERYGEPNRFDPNRFVAGCPGPADYCPFGHGTHACVGVELTMEIARTLCREAAVGWQIRTVADGPAWRINRHWGIWRPSSLLRVSVAARAGSGDGALPL